jgi:NifU-like N terminal domain
MAISRIVSLLSPCITTTQTKNPHTFSKVVAKVILNFEVELATRLTDGRTRRQSHVIRDRTVWRSVGYSTVKRVAAFDFSFEAGCEEEKKYVAATTHTIVLELENTIHSFSIISITPAEPFFTMMLSRSSKLVAQRLLLVAPSRSSRVAMAARGYHDNIVEHYENPRNVGSLDKNDESVGMVCGFSSHCARNRYSLSFVLCVFIVGFGFWL